MSAMMSSEDNTLHLTVLAYAAIAFGVFAYVIKHAYQAYQNPLAAVPGPFLSRWTDLVRKVHALRGDKIKWVHSLHQQYGPIVRISPNEASVVDPEATREIHRISTPFRKSEFYIRFASGVSKDGGHVRGLFTFSDPKQHSARRRLLAQPMSETALKNVEPTVNKNITKAIEGIEHEMKMNGGPADIFKWLTFMATDVIGELSFAESFRMLDQAKPNQYFYDLQHIGIFNTLRSELSILTKLIATLGIKPFSQAFPASHRLRGYAEQSLKRYEQHVALNPTNPKPTLFTKLFTKEAGSEGEELRQSDVITREAMSYIVAGSDTTAVTTTYSIYSVTRHPEVQQKLVEELSRLPENFGWDHVRNARYLNHVIDETLRLYGAAPGSLPRVVPEGGANLVGYDFPSGTVVSTQAYTLHRNPTIFKDPERFMPERWENPSLEMQHAFMAFGGGTRICIGMHLARDEMRMAIALFFRRFPRARTLTSDEDMDFKSYFLISPKTKKCMVVGS